MAELAANPAYEVWLQMRTDEATRWPCRWSSSPKQFVATDLETQR